MTAADSKIVPPPVVPGMSHVVRPVPFWRRLALFGSAVGIQVEGANLRVAVARLRPTGTHNPAAFTIQNFRSRPAVEWRAEYQGALKAAGVSHLAATLVLPRTEVIVRIAQFPGVADKDMQSAVALELDTLHPYGDEAVQWAWTRLSPQATHPEGKAGAILIGIVRSITLERYEALFREAGIPVSAITFSASALYSALRLYTEPGGEFLAWLDTPDGGGEVYGESPSRAVFSAQADVLPQALAMGAAELRLAENAQAIPLNSILPHPRKVAASGPAATLAWAAALSGAASWVAHPANLLPADRRETVSRGRLIPTFVLVACVIAVGIALSLQKQFAQRQYLKQLNAQIAELQPKAQRSTAIDRRIAQARARIDLLDRFRTQTKDDIEIVNELTRLLPPPVWISSLEIHPDNVVITGEADQAAPLLKALDSSPLFRNSEFGTAVARNGANETFRIKTLRRRPQ